MRVNIYYGGRGLIDDPTLYVLEKITKVLDELPCHQRQPLPCSSFVPYN